MGYAMKNLREMESTQQEGIGLVKARAELDLHSFGIQLEEFPKGTTEDKYPSHSHEGDSQDEVYLCLSGSGEVNVDDEGWSAFESGTFIKIDPESTRRFRSEEGMQLLAMSAPTNSGYQAPDWTEKGETDSSSEQSEEQGASS